MRRLLACLLVLAFPAGASADIASPPGLDAYASRIVGHPVIVTCYPYEDPVGEGAIGYVRTWWLDEEKWGFEDVIHLRGDICGFYALASTYRSRSPRIRNYAHSWQGTSGIGMMILAVRHEATHIRDRETNEGIVECNTYRNAWKDVVSFGFSSTMRRDVWTGVTDTHQSGTSEYRTVC